jgi:hypothetical protein
MKIHLHHQTLFKDFFLFRALLVVQSTLIDDTTSPPIMTQAHIIRLPPPPNPNPGHQTQKHKGVEKKSTQTESPYNTIEESFPSLPFPSLPKSSKPELQKSNSRKSRS